MTDDPRATRLRAAARTKSETKAKAADAAIRELTKQGRPIGFRTVAQRAGVSHSFLYANPDLRSRIEHLREQQKPKPTPRAEPTAESVLVQALTSKIEQLKREHRSEITGLRQALEAAHGENLALRRLLTEHGVQIPI